MTSPSVSSSSLQIAHVVAAVSGQTARRASSYLWATLSAPSLPHWFNGVKTFKRFLLEEQCVFRDFIGRNVIEYSYQCFH